jgi:prephenate dehydrogenase
LKTLDFVSPIYKLMIASVSRYIGHSPELYADIQMNNEEILKIHDLFTKSS